MVIADSLPMARGLEATVPGECGHFGGALHVAE
jgi:hypothetical protein